MGSEDIWVLIVSALVLLNGLWGKAVMLTFARSIVSNASFLRRSLLSIAVSDAPAISSAWSRF